MDDNKKEKKLNNGSTSSPQASSQNGQVGQVPPVAEVSETDKLKQERDEYLNGWKRAKADLMNYQRDEAKRFEDMANYSREMVISDLIVVLDSFAALERSSRSEPRSKEFERELGGVLMINGQLEEALKRYGLEKIKVSPGDAFDPSLHESLGEIESSPSTDSTSSPQISSGKVAVEISSGYKIKNKVIRPTRVKLVK